MLGDRWQNVSKRSEERIKYMRFECDYWGLQVQVNATFTESEGYTHSEVNVCTSSNGRRNLARPRERWRNR